MPSVFRKHANEIDVAAISANGAIVLTVGRWGEANVYERESAREISTIKPMSPLHGKAPAPFESGTFVTCIDSAALSSNGDIALLGLNDRSAVAYTTSDGQLLATLRLGEEIDFGVIRAVKFSHNGKLAAVGFMDRTVGLWSTSDWSQLCVLQPQDGERLLHDPIVRDTLVSSLSFSSDDEYLFVGNADETAHTWKLSTQEVVFAATEHVQEVIAIRAIDDEVTWCTSGGSIWHCENDEKPQCLYSLSHVWSEGKFSPDGSRLLIRTRSGPVLLFEKEDRSFELKEQFDCRPIVSAEAVTLGFAPSSKHYCFVKSEKELVLRDGTDEKTITRNEDVLKVLFSPCGKFLATCGWKDQAELWSTDTGELLHAAKPSGFVCSMAFSPNGKLFAVGEIGDGLGPFARHALIYDASSGKLLSKFEADQFIIDKLAFTADSKWLLSVSRQVKIHSLDGQDSFSLGDEHDVSHLTYVLPFLDGRFLISFGEKYELRHQQNAEKVLCQGKVSIAKHHNWSTDLAGKKLYVQNEKGLSRYNINSSEKMKPIELPIPNPRTNFPDSKSTDMWPSFFASLWQCPGGPFVHVTDGPRGWKEDVGTSPDGRYSLVPCTKGAAILSLEGKEPTIKSKMQFHGRLRAFAFVENEVYAINHLGTLFIGTL